MNNLNDDQTKTWGIVELMGHKVVAGMISKSEMLGKPMLRVDVPSTSAFGEFTQFYGESAIYCVTFVSEQVARLTAEQNKVNPVSVYVPDLVTREAHKKTVKQYRDEIQRMRALTDGRSDEAIPGVADRIEELWEKDTEEDDAEEEELPF